MILSILISALVIGLVTVGAYGYYLTYRNWLKSMEKYEWKE